MNKRTIIFNHIPKTGGITLRIILDKVYGAEKIFLMNSTDIGSSVHLFHQFSEEKRNSFDVIAGHGADMLSPLIKEPFRITILREPVSLFLSQFHFLKISRNTDFYRDVSKMDGPMEYLTYALEKGQDNLMTRYLSDSIGFLADPASTVPAMEQEGEKLLSRAKKNLREYDAVIDLSDFDAGIYALSHLLGWKKIPIYRPSNRNRKNPGRSVLSFSVEEPLRNLLKYDIALYDFFKKEKLDSGNEVLRNGLYFKAFRFRQLGIRFAADVLQRH